MKAGIGIDPKRAAFALFSKTARLLAVMTIVGLYSLAVVSTVDDASIVFDSDITIIPFINARITASLFLWWMPLVVLLTCHYFQANLFALGTIHRLDYTPAATESDTSFIFEDLLAPQILQRQFVIRDYALLVISYLVTWVIVPVTLVVAWKRSLPTHNSLLSYYCLFVLAFNLGVSLTTLFKLRMRSGRLLGPCASLLVLAVLALAIITHGLALKVPSVCFENPLHDQNHPFFDRNLTSSECSKLGSAITRFALQQWSTLGFGLGPELAFVNLSTPFKSGDRVKPPVFPDLNLGNAHGTGFVAQHATMVRADLTGAELVSADLTDANFKFGTLFLTDMREATLELTSFIRTRATYVDFSNAHLEKSWFRGSTMENAHFTAAVMKEAQMECASFVDADFTGADLTGAELTNARFINAKLQGVKSLAGANTMGTQFLHSSLPERGLSIEQRAIACGTAESGLQGVVNLGSTELFEFIGSD